MKLEIDDFVLIQNFIFFNSVNFLNFGVLLSANLVIFRRSLLGFYGLPSVFRNDPPNLLVSVFASKNAFRRRLCEVKRYKKGKTV
jgi:hypothetical protein